MCRKSFRKKRDVFVEVFAVAITFSALSVLVSCGSPSGGGSGQSFVANPDGNADAPIASVAGGSSVSIDVLDNDTLIDPSNSLVKKLVSVSANGRKGTASVDTSGGRITYAASNGSAGNDTFTYTASAGSMVSSAVVCVNIISRDTGPGSGAPSVSAANDTYNILQSQTNLRVLDNDTPGPSNMTITDASDLNARIARDQKTIDYDATGLAPGTASFQYTAKAGVLSSSATVTLNVRESITCTLINDVDSKVDFCFGEFVISVQGRSATRSAVPRSANERSPVTIITKSSQPSVGSDTISAVLLGPKLIRFSGSPPRLSVQDP